MKVLVTGSAGHLGEALVRTLKGLHFEVIGLDINSSPYTSHIGTITDRSFVRECMNQVKMVFHTATLHKPHIVTHTHQQFIDTNISGTLNLLQESVQAGVESFIFTSTTSVFGDALIPPIDQPAAWITEDVIPIPKNIYGITKAASEDLCRLFYRKHHLPCIILRTSRFFPEADDDRLKRHTYADANLKVNEYLFGRADLEDIVSAHLAAAEHASNIGFAQYIISATTPFSRDDVALLRTNAPEVVQRYCPDYKKIYAWLGWKMLPSIDRVYDNSLARSALGWQPKYDFRYIISLLAKNEGFFSPLAKKVGSKGYHAETFQDGPYPVDTFKSDSMGK